MGPWLSTSVDVTGLGSRCKALQEFFQRFSLLLKAFQVNLCESEDKDD